MTRNNNEKDNRTVMRKCVHIRVKTLINMHDRRWAKFLLEMKTYFQKY